MGLRGGLWDDVGYNLWAWVFPGAATAAAQKERICSEELGISISSSPLDVFLRSCGHEVIGV